MDDILILAAILCIVALVAVFINKRLLTLLLSSAFMLLVAMRLNVPSMYLMGTVLLALPLASWAVGWYGAQRIEVVLNAPETAFEGDEFKIRMDVICALPAFSLLAKPRCELPKWFRAVEGSETTVAIPSGIRQEFAVQAERRGVFDLALGGIVVNDPLGIFSIVRRSRQTRSLVVHPRGLSPGDFSIVGGQNTGWLLELIGGRRGDEDGFFGTREYRSGDDIRRIHWRSSARTGALVVAERENWVRSTVWICLDSCLPSSPSPADEAALERAVKTVVSIMETTLGRGHRVGLRATGKEDVRIVPRDGDDQRWEILDALAHLKADGVMPLSEVVMQLATEPGSMVVLVTGNPTAKLVAASSRIRHDGTPAILVAVESESPVNPSNDFDAGIDAAAAAGLDYLVVRAPVKAANSGAGH